MKTRRQRPWVNFLTVTVVGLLFDLLAGLVAMVFLGFAHATDSRVPAFGFWTCASSRWH